MFRVLWGTYGCTYASILSVRDLPDHQKENWINMFKHYVFDYENNNFDHIPKDIHGAVGNIDDNLAKKIELCCSIILIDKK